MKIFVVGLGLMGASYAEGLHQHKHQIYGYDQDESILNRAKQLFLESNNQLSDLSKADLIILALYPKDNILFVRKNKHLFRANQVLTDISGTKVSVINQIIKELPDDVSYTSHHPMAGRETSGFDQRDVTMFKGANFMIVPTAKTKETDIPLLEGIAYDLEFGKITVVDAKTHDELIAFTSQLTHLIAVGLVQSDQQQLTKSATGDSFRDLTRIAKINELMWSELFLQNQEALLAQIDHFAAQIQHLRDLIETNDQEKLIQYLKVAKEKRKSFDEN